MGNMSLSEDISRASRRTGLNRLGRRPVIWAGAALLLGLGTWWIWGGPGPQPRQTPPAPVVVGLVEQRPVTMFENTLGKVVATASVQVTARVQGQLLSAAFKEGDMVRKGDVLFQLDPRPFQAALAQATAIRDKNRAQANAAQQDAARYAALVQEGAVSRSLAEQFAANAKALAASVAADQANVEAARLDISYAKIISPVDGKTGAITLQPGNIVPANGTTPLVTITQTQPIKISFALPQHLMPRIQSQMKAGTLFVSLTLQDSSHTQMRAPVDFISNQVDERSGTIELRATFDNAANSLVPGQLMDVRVALGQLENALVVPQKSLNTGPDFRFVYFVNEQDSVELRKVTLLYDDGEIAAVQGDLKPRDKVVIQGQLRLVPGVKVSIHPAQNTP